MGRRELSSLSQISNITQASTLSHESQLKGTKTFEQRKLSGAKHRKKN